MRVLYWMPFFLPDTGGIETLSSWLMPELRRRGHQIVALASYGSHPAPAVVDFEGIAVHRFHIHAAFEKHDLRQIALIRAAVARLKAEFKPQLVHLHFSDTAPFFHLMTQGSHPIPTLTTIHDGSDYYGLKGGPDTLLGKTLAASDWVTAVSQATLDETLRLAPDIAGKSSVVYSGRLPMPVEPAPLPFDPPVILSLGRLVHKKGIDVLLAAFARLVRRFPSAQLWIAGDGLLHAELTAQAAGMGDAVRFLGFIDNDKTPDLYNRATLVALASRNEGLPITAIEAALMGRPLVTTSAGGLPEIAEHGRSGLVVNPDDPEALAQALAWMIEHPQQAQAMGLAGRARAESMFSLRRCAEDYSNLYERLGHD